mmetsp:Transcript_2253/g.7149  ORF Transcript_2253/g.7149 Transcript_2253/m.7149 type:complete len:226 (-) Transcript_2253:1222-1899(-)
MAREPPPKTVYQRILKPYPSVMVDIKDPTASCQDLSTLNLFVEVCLIRADSDGSLPECLEGNRVVRLGTGIFATFTKLKILSTSQQQGTLFRLRFRLKRYSGSSFVTIPDAEVLSNPIEVFSHTLYLNERGGKRKTNAPPPPMVSEVLPNSGGAGCRVVILGASFLKSNRLRVRFGEAAVPAVFHECGTIICTTPPCTSSGPVRVSVTNDGRTYCKSSVIFSYHQ